jgi:hypothetical protein
LNIQEKTRSSSRCVEVTPQRRITESILSQKFLRRKLNGRNSPRRTPEIARTIGSKEVVGEVKHWIDPPSKGRIQRGPLISIIGPLRSFQHFEGHKSIVWAKPLVDQIPKMKKEFLCIKTKSDEVRNFKTSKFRVWRS